MVKVNQALCEGCGVCVDECLTQAITLVNDTALVDVALCDGCGVCIEVCPNGALTWVAEPVPEAIAEPSSLVVVQPPVEVIPVRMKEAAPWRRAVLPAVGGALAWVGREFVPRLAPLAMDALDNARDWRLGRSAGSRSAMLTPTDRERGRGGRQRRRRRRGE